MVGRAQPDVDRWGAVRDTHWGTDHRIDDYARFSRTFLDLDRPALLASTQASLMGDWRSAPDSTPGKLLPHR